MTVAVAEKVVPVVAVVGVMLLRAVVVACLLVVAYTVACLDQFDRDAVSVQVYDVLGVSPVAVHPLDAVAGAAAQPARDPGDWLSA